MKKFISILVIGALCVPSLGFALSATESAEITATESEVTASMVQQDISVKDIIVEKTDEYDSEGKQKVKFSTYVLNENPKEDTVLWWGYKVDGESLYNDRFDLKSTYFSVLLTKGDEYEDFYLAPGKHTIKAYANPEIIDYTTDNNVLTKKIEIFPQAQPAELEIEKWDIIVDDVLIKKFNEYNDEGKQKVQLSTRVLNVNPRADEMVWWGYNIDGQSIGTDHYRLKSTDPSVLLTREHDFYLVPGKHTIEAYVNPYIIENTKNNQMEKKIEISFQNVSEKNPETKPMCANHPGPSFCEGGLKALYSAGTNSAGCAIWKCKINDTQEKKEMRKKRYTQPRRNIFDRILRKKNIPQKRNTKIINDRRRMENNNVVAIEKKKNRIPNNQITQTVPSYEDDVRVNEFEDEVVVNNGHFFPDTDTNSLEGKAAAYLHALGVIGGFPDGEFKGDRLVTRAELAKFLVLGAQNVGGASSISNSWGFRSDNLSDDGRFPDIIKGEWYWSYVVKAADFGIMEGYPDGRLRPEKTVNTAEFLKMISHTFNIRRNMKYYYDDTFDSHWFGKYAGAAEKYKLFPFRDSEYLEPGLEMTRKDVAIALFRYLRQRNLASDNFPLVNNTSQQYLDCVRTKSREFCDKFPTPEVGQKRNVVSSVESVNHKEKSDNQESFLLFNNDKEQQKISVSPGQKNVEIFSLKFVAGKKPAKISSLKFRRVGKGDINDFDTLQLYTNNKNTPISKRVKVKKDIVEIPFHNSLHFDAQETKYITLKADISLKAKKGNNSRFVLFLPEWVGASEEIVGFFPFGGRSVVISFSEES